MVGRCEPSTQRDPFREYIDRVVAQAPPLTAQQKADLREILRPVAVARREMAVPR